MKKSTINQEWTALDDVADRKKKQREQRIKYGDLKGLNGFSLPCENKMIFETHPLIFMRILRIINTTSKRGI